jgi:hypothetical protein
MKTILTLILAFTSALISADELEKRIDFGDSQILGQSNDAGAIYLSHRKANAIESLLSYRLHYRDELLADFDYWLIDLNTGLPIEADPFIEDEVVLTNSVEGSLK